ncbi:heme ABC transporter ATP-binding protein [Neptunicoccus cionae]|uniref:Hemin import ATP-binding protein HmuV n=1 Tax=Neptunicoccus cionae TaxID=2035344 RepID=A0A916QY26_9RHOB|nr:heme ABC transporter ATP-binding protein [Amylibacter cionae]GGA20062.1 hemin import ATP-binding protein HmuV [Amylibacter cionae]
MITGRNIDVAFGPKTILRGVDVDVPFGKLVALCGPNGAGKSTLLSALVGDVPTARGEIHYGNTELRHMDAADLSRHRAVLEQSPTLSAAFSVAEVVRLSIPIEYPPTDTQVLVAKVIALLGLELFADTPVPNLSGGQRHRAHLARVLAQLTANRNLFGPGYLFLDEPTASLDILHQIEVMKTARTMARSGAGVLVVLHDLNLAAAFADSICLMRNGRVASSGKVGEVFTAQTLSEVYATPISVQKTGESPLMILPDYHNAA